MIVKELNFRYLCSNYVVIQNRAIAGMAGGPEEADAFLAGAYIHPEDGLCYMIMDTAVFEPYRRMHLESRADLKIRDSTVRMNEVKPVRLKRKELLELDAEYEPFAGRQERSPIPAVQKTARDDWRLDPWRLRQYPDRLSIPVSEKCELIVIPETSDGLVYIGKVIELSGPSSEWKCGDAIGFVPVRPDQKTDKKTDRFDLSIWKQK